MRLWRVPFGLVCGVLLAASSGASNGAGAGKPPVIKHEPVTIAVPGQPVYVRAVVTDDSGAVKSVTLFYSSSRDASPLKAAMQNTGAGSYFGSIPANMLTGKEAHYYIEAMDEEGLTAETPWYTIKLEAASVGGGPAVAAGPGAPPPARAHSWTKPALIAGGALLVAGGALAVASGSGGGGGGGGGGGSTNTTGGTSGTYAGSATVCLQLSSESPNCSSHPITFTVTSSGLVSSDNLQPGQHLEATLSGSDFTMVAPVATSNLTGQIRYAGTVFSGRIAGTVDGQATSTSGPAGVYSGFFNAAKQP